MFGRLLSNGVSLIARIGADPDDSEDVRLQKALLRVWLNDITATHSASYLYAHRHKTY
jgi:hypothetical protein